MLDYSLVLKEFYNHYTKFDISDEDIERKYFHSIRVMNIAMMICSDLYLNSREKEIVFISSILHDYGRFEQWMNYHTYSDSKSIDHADLGVMRLFEDREIEKFKINRDYYDVVYDAIKNHNKFSVSDNVNLEHLTICNVIRDADKLDIFYLFGIDKDLQIDDDSEISSKVESDFYKHKTINRIDVKTVNDSVILNLAMIFDLNFKFSYKYLYDNKLIEKIYDNLENKELLKKYFDYVIEYIRYMVK